VVVILVDTLRADRLGAYGNPRGLTPFVDSLAARGFVFERAFAQSSWTNPSVASLFTSRFQSQHGIVTFSSVLAPASTLAESLRNRGYATGGFVANGLVGPEKGFDQGFERYLALWPEFQPPPAPAKKRRAEAIDELALKWLDELQKAPARPVFLYLHYVEPHPPYSPPDPVLDRVLAGKPRPDLAAISMHMTFAIFDPPNDDERRELELVYDAEVASMDESLQRLFAELDKRGFLQRSIIVFTSDHGEEFADHESFGHGRSLYNEVIHVPLILVVPGRTTGRRITDVVSLVDVAPTILDLTGTFRPPPFEGRSLRSLLADEGWSWKRLWRRPEPAAAFSELLRAEGERRHRPHETAVVLGQRKLIVGPEGESELYDLEADPAEKQPVTGQDGKELRHRLVDLVRHRDGHVAAGQPAPMDPETERRLRAFGYVN
jgi:arylsulfatase A-like enzyme